MTGEGEAEPKRTSAVYGDGMSFVQWSLLWLLGGVIGLVAIAFDLAIASGGARAEWLHGLWPASVPGRDFTNLWTAGRLVLSGAPGCVFDPHCLQARILQDLHIETVQNYSYPPSALLIAVPFGALPYYAALALWTVGGACFFAWAARPFLPKGFSPALAALTPAAAINIWNGHYGFLLGGLWLLFFRELERRPARAGVLAGLLTFKPHLGIMIAVSSLRSRATLAWGTATVIALVLLSGELFGWQTWRAFFTETTVAQANLLRTEATRFYFMLMPSPYVQFGRGTGRLFAQLLFAGAAVMLLVKYRRWDAFSAATATFLIVPYCFNYDMTVACLGFAILLFERWSSLGRVQRAVLMVAFVSPELTFFAGPIVPFALLAALQVQLKSASARSFGEPVEARNSSRRSIPLAT